MAQLVTAERRLGRSVQTTSVPPVGLSSVLPASSLPACVSRSLRPLLWSSPAVRVSSPFPHSARVALGGSSTSTGRGDPPACGHQAAVPHHVPGVRESLRLPAPGWLSLEIHCTTHSSQLHTQTFLFTLRPTSPSVFSILVPGGLRQGPESSLMFCDHPQ